MRLHSLSEVFDRWIRPPREGRSGPRWFRRHGFPPEEDTARHTAPKGGARLRRYHAERLRASRRTQRSARRMAQEARDGV